MREQTKFIGTVAYMGGIPSVPTPFLDSWTQFLVYNGKHLGPIFYYNPDKTSFHAQARNQIVDKAKGDWILMLDTDNKFAPDILHRMLKRMEHHELDVLVGYYQFKSRPHSPVIFNWDEQTGVPNRVIEMQAFPFDQFFYSKIQVAGAGCLLVKLSVYERIISELKQNPFDIIPPLGEDFSFFKRLKDLNIEAFCDPAIHVEHLRWQGTIPPEYNAAEYYG